MGVCASSELEPTQDTFSVETDSVEPIDPKELHSRCKKLLELSNIVPVLIMPKVVQHWRRNAKLNTSLIRISAHGMIQAWKAKAIQTPVVRKKLNKMARIRNEVAILAELRESRR
tara:strand:+ start:159 stop:503 length:345 start_codon:yes stop_codon:yes gene_type:complete